MKTMVISCIEPHHLINCIRGLKLWMGKEDIYIINNAFDEQKIAMINETVKNQGVNVIRPEYVEGQKDTKPFIHRITNDFARAFPDELILKLDEDVILISEEGVPNFERGVFYMPLSTINNYTTRIYAREFWPDMYAKCSEHRWMWHNKEPFDIKEELFYKVYRSDPVQLIEFTRNNIIREKITVKNHVSKNLMGKRGISTHTVFFHAQDHIDNYIDANRNQEVHFYNLIKEGKFCYEIDYNMFCHHINYFTLRDLVKKESDLVKKFHERIFSIFERKADAPTPCVINSERAKVCVGTGWYSDLKRGKIKVSDLEPRLFDPSYLSSVFVPRVKRGLNPRAIHIYVSECEVPPHPMPEGCEIVRGRRPAKRYDTPGGQLPYVEGAAHDWGASIMTGAMFAYVNSLDYFYVEQDCLIHNFKGVYEVAKEMKAPIIYGYGAKASWTKRWAEPSLTFVSCDFLPEFIRRLYKGLWHIWNESFIKVKNPEIQFHNVFEDVAQYWPFGSGMKRPIDWESEMYFAQRFDTPNFEKFLSRSPNG